MTANVDRPDVEDIGREIGIDQRFFTPELRELAERIFVTQRVHGVGRYADPATLSDVILNVMLGATGSGLWAAIQAGVPLVAQFVRDWSSRPNAPTPEQIVCSVQYQAHGVTYEVRFRASDGVDEYRHGKLISSIDSGALHQDTARVSINLIGKYIKLFDAEGLLVGNLPWPGSTGSDA